MMNTIPLIEDGSIAAAARYHVWSGVPAVIIAAPPGAGKTTVITQILPEIVRDAGFKVAVAAQTRSQSADIANRLDAVMPGQVALLASGRDKIQNSTGTYLKKPRELADGVHFVAKVDDAFRKGATVVVANTAKWRYFRSDSALEDFTLLVVDEAWQSTIGDFREMAGIASQSLLVGDPGQIAPVVSADTSRFAASSYAPHLPAPNVLMQHHAEHTVFLQMPTTHRCGPETTAVLQPLYPFPFESARKPQHVEVDGVSLPEIEVSFTTSGSPSDARMFDAVAAKVVELSQAAVVVEGVKRPMKPTDVAVCVAHVHQVTAIRARLPKELADVTIDTAERTQGLQWVAVCILDPMAGLNEIAAHNADTGRLCVGLSRSTAHTAFITTPEVVDILESDPDDAVAVLGAEVRRTLMSVSL